MERIEISNESNAADHDNSSRPLYRCEHPAWLSIEHTYDDHAEERSPERIRSIADHAECGTAHRIALIPEGICRHGTEAGNDKEDDRPVAPGAGKKAWSQSGTAINHAQQGAA